MIKNKPNEADLDFTEENFSEEETAYVPNGDVTAKDLTTVKNERPEKTEYENKKTELRISKKKQVLIYVLVFLGVFAISLTLGFLYGIDRYVKSVTGEEANFCQLELLSPDDYYLYQKLESPKYSAENDSYFAVLENSDTVHRITVYDKTEKDYYTFDADSYGFTSYANISKIALFSSNGNDYVVVQYDLKLFSINIKTGKKTNIVEEADPANAITSRSFDLNDQNFVIAKENTVNWYVVSSNENDNVILKKKFASENSNQQSCVCINENFYFYNVSSTVYKVNLISNTVENSTVIHSSINSLTANKDRLFFIAENNVYYIDINDFKAEPNIGIENTVNNVLGKISSPISISVYKDTLSVIDGKTATVQYFDSVDFTFTGKAVATNETTFNRISKNTLSMSTYGNKLAFLSNTSVKIVDLSTLTFSEHVFPATSFNTISIVSIGNDSITVSNGEDIFFKKFSQNTWTAFSQEKNTFYTSSFMFDKYYFLSSSTTGDYLTVFNENDFNDFVCYTLNAPKGSIDKGSSLTVDIDGNIYFYNGLTVYKYVLDGNDYVFETDFDLNVPSLKSEEVFKIGIDLTKNVYALATNNRVFKIDPQGNQTTFNLVLSDNLTEKGGIGSHKANDFSMNFDNKNVYFIFEGESFILSTTNLENQSSDNIEKPTTLSLSGETGDLTVKKVIIENVSAFKVNLEEENVFGYEYQFFTTDKEYLLIGETSNGYAILLSSSVGSNSELILVDKEKLPTEQVSLTTEDCVLVVSSSVNLYHYPIITQDNSCCIYGDEKPVRLDVGTALNVSKSLNFNGKAYLFVNCQVNGKTYEGYVPKDFTSNEIFNELLPQKFQLVKIKNGTKVYNGENEPIYTFSKVTSLLSAKNTENEDTLIVIYDDNGTRKLGVIEKSYLVKNTTDSVKNYVLIILSVVALFLVALFFIYKKKTYVTEN